ncbi:hypothetical protein [Flavobacterium panici]|uniref:NERD domain-containing protein n=1 Tax=Flavobacterium panici TaxID=2654843 RepID=A0A9N8P0M9_9FLAO|nr:hypothetical protein [Flavobacterium panici]CAC9973231.1 hypothetical protein FLAPXU55_00910 [Flavobacterium panici]
MTPSEKYVSELCEKSFLPFWSFSNPIGKKGKELCDILIVCENTIIIISVKDIRMSENKDENIKYDRWVKKAVLDSVEQIYGAERFLETTDEVFLKNRIRKIKLPPKNKRIIHRIAIAFGSTDNFPLPTGDFGKGFVSVFDEKSTFTILNELDTITDFTSYLVAKEKFIEDKVILIPTEADFLAFYLQTGFDVHIPDNSILAGEKLWEDYLKSEEYSQWKEDIEVSYIWDIMIHLLHKFHLNEKTDDLRFNELEEAIRTINLEPRINRIELGLSLEDAIKTKVKARMLKPLQNSKHSYVFMPLNEHNWEEKKGELELRCMVARYENPNVEKVIGISIGSNNNGETCFDILAITIPEINDEFVNDVNIIKKELGYFVNPVISTNKRIKSNKQ